MYETWLIVPLAIVYGALLALALSEWVRHPQARTLNRWAWPFIIIVIFSLIGPAAYLYLGCERSGGRV
jgi:hypothetical protein